ncbi:MAG: hypothetical protein FJ098_08075 [Deltaproteobacteria bacterium]|nr:hypothetical protein [Deltaproteobacteria bacterium]
MENNDRMPKKPYTPPRLEVREGFERNVLQSGCVFQPNLATPPCGWATPSA